MSDVKIFKKGRVVRDPKPILKTGTEIKAELDALQPSPDGDGFLGYGGLTNGLTRRVEAPLL